MLLGQRERERLNSNGNNGAEDGHAEGNVQWHKKLKLPHLFLPVSPLGLSSVLIHQIFPEFSRLLLSK